jgi:threonine/homoserine/homoserine lactone efflux protein
VILQFFIAAILIELTPGPNMTWLAVLGATKGRSRAFAAVAGIALGLAIAAGIAGAGLTALLYEAPALFTGLRWAGTLYLLYLAWEAWQDGGAKSDNSSSTTQAFQQGLITNILNPKAYLFYAALLPQFVDPARDAAAQIFTLSAIYVTVATVIHSGIALLAGSAASWLENSPNAVVVRKVLAVFIAIAAIWFFYSTGKTS